DSLRTEGRAVEAAGVEVAVGLAVDELPIDSERPARRVPPHRTGADSKTAAGLMAVELAEADLVAMRCTPGQRAHLEDPTGQAGRPFAGQTMAAGAREQRQLRAKVLVVADVIGVAAGPQ